MMKSYCIIVLFALLFFDGCSPWKDKMIYKGDQNDAVQNAIVDFLHTENARLKKDSVFWIQVMNLNDQIVCVDFSGATDYKESPHPKNKIGTSIPGFPTNFIEKEGKLFYWYDPGHTITSDLIAVLSKYKHIDSIYVKGLPGISQYMPPNKEGVKSVQYFFCRCNLLKYKKVITERVIGYYKPHMNCDCDPWTGLSLPKGDLNQRH